MKKLHVTLIGGGKLSNSITESLEAFTVIDSKTPFDTIDFEHTDIILDVSSADVIQKFLPKINKPLIIGSTGHCKKTLEDLKMASFKIPVLIAPNFSYGIYLLKKLMREISSPPTLIKETHHIHKKDTPSGTAKDLASLFESPPPIDAIRQGEVFGEHKVIYNLGFEEITLTHTAESRALFAYGAIKAATFLYEKPAGLYTMENVYDEESSYAQT